MTSRWPLTGENVALWLAERTDLRAGEDGGSGAAARAAARTLRVRVRVRAGLWAWQDGAAARAEPRRSAQVWRVLGASSGAPGHALQGPDVREPEPDRAGIHHVSPEQVTQSQQSVSDEMPQVILQLLQYSTVKIPRYK